MHGQWSYLHTNTKFQWSGSNQSGPRSSNVFKDKKSFKFSENVTISLLQALQVLESLNFGVLLLSQTFTDWLCKILTKVIGLTLGCLKCQEQPLRRIQIRKVLKDVWNNQKLGFVGKELFYHLLLADLQVREQKCRGKGLEDTDFQISGTTTDMGLLTKAMLSEITITIDWHQESFLSYQS